MGDQINKIHLISYTFSKRILEDCVGLWDQDILPSIEQLKYEYGILDIDGRCLDPVSYYQFWSAINHLSEHGFITIMQDSNIVKRISQGPRKVPEHLSYEYIWSI